MGLKRWTTRDVEFMKQNYETMSYKEIAKILGHSEGSTATKLSSLGLTKKRNDWSSDDVEFLKSNYATMMYSDMSKKLNRSEGAIRAKCFDLNLVKKDAWTESELEFLKSNYSEMSNKEIADFLKRTENSVHLKANKLGLKKSPYYCNYRFFENIDTEEKAYWLGFFYADGWVTINQKTNSGVAGIELQVGDINHLKKFNKSIGGNYKITTRTREHEFEGRIIRSDECCIRVFSRSMVDDLINHGVIQNKSYKLEFPNIDESLYPHFIRGHFDGDGSIFYSKGPDGKYRTNCNCVSVYKPFLDRIREILYKQGIYSHICISSKASKEQYYDLYCLSISDHKSVEKYLYYIYGNANVYLDRKYKRYMNRPENTPRERLASQK